MGLLSRSVIRKLLQKVFPKLADSQFEVLLIIILFIVSGLSVVKYRSEEAKKMAMLNEVADLRDKANDLENKTQEVSRLPDGRALFGVIITGKPILLLEEHNQAIAAFSAKNFVSCLTHSQNAVQAHEETLQILAETANYGTEGGAWLSTQDIAKLYYLAATCAERLGEKELAIAYHQKTSEYPR